MKTLTHYSRLHHLISYSANKNFLVILCMSIIHLAFGQSTFQKAYGTTLDCKLVSAQETTDGNIITAGNLIPGNIFNPPYTLPGVRERICLMKTNMNGDTLWTKTFGAIDHYRCNSMLQTTDNGFILGGRVTDTIVGDSKFIVIKTDANGNLTWSRTYNSSDNNEELFSIKETATGDYVMAGNGFVGKINATGNVIWSNDLKSHSANLNLRSIDNTYDGGVIICGSLDTTGSSSYAYLAKMNSAGTIIWSKTYKSSHNMNEMGYSVSQTSDRGFIFTGLTYQPVAPMMGTNQVYLAKTDSLGNLQWSKKFGSGANETGYDVKQTSDGGYIVTGTSSGMVGNGLWTNNAFLIKTNTNGIVNWCNYYGLVGNSWDVPASVSVLNSGGYLVAGLTTDNIGYPNRFYILKTNASGNVNCHGNNWPLFDSVYVSYAQAYNQSISTLALTTSSPALNETHFLCETIDACTAGVTGIQNNITKNDQIQISPNPTNGSLVITSLDIISNTKVEIIDALGKIILSQNFEELNTAIIDISNLPRGIYFLKINVDENNVIKKIIKE